MKHKLVVLFSAYLLGLVPPWAHLLAGERQLALTASKDTGILNVHAFPVFFFKSRNFECCRYKRLLFIIPFIRIYQREVHKILLFHGKFSVTEIYCPSKIEKC